MKVIMKPIKIIASFTKEGNMLPKRYQLTENESEQITINIERILLTTEEKIAGERTITYRCQSVINEIITLYELKYNVPRCKWFLFRM